MAAAGTDPAQEFVAWAGARQHAFVRTAYLLTGDLHRAEDLVQEALVQVALRWRRLAAGNPEAYARQVIVRTNVSWWRRRRRELVGAVPDRAGRGEADEVDRRLVLSRALARLTPKQRAVLVLRFYDDLGEAEVAEAWGMSVGTVKSQTHAALKRLGTGAPELGELIGGIHP